MLNTIVFPQTVIYYMSLFKLPVRVAKEIDKIQANFLWGGSDLRRKVHMVKWEAITKSKNLGGLGVRRSADMNKCLLMKWWWRFGAENNTWWKDVICSKYNMGGGRWLPHLEGNIRASKIWSDIINAVRSQNEFLNFYLDNAVIQLGNGRRAHFWLDKWSGELCLKTEFPRLFSLSTDKYGTVSDFYSRRGGLQDWNLDFRRPLLAWEEEEVRRLYILISSVPDIRVSSPDIWKWKADPTGLFSVASVYKRCELSLGPGRNVAVAVWHNCAPPKVKFFGWLAWQGKVKTSSFLQRIGILDANANVGCVFCHDEVETVYHILLFCPFVWLLWSHIMKWWGVQWVMPNSVERLLEWWSFCKMKKIEKQLWKVVPLAVLWSIWKHRNDCVFNGLQPNVEDLCELVKVRIAVWVKSSPVKMEFSVNDIVLNLQQVQFCSESVLLDCEAQWWAVLWDCLDSVDDMSLGLPCGSGSESVLLVCPAGKRVLSSLLSVLRLKLYAAVAAVNFGLLFCLKLAQMVKSVLFCCSGTNLSPKLLLRH
ncbi:hypothetical protein ACSBR1_013560 [Camellia fascicularis]